MQAMRNARPLFDSPALCIHWAARLSLGPMPTRAYPSSQASQAVTGRIPWPNRHASDLSVRPAWNQSCSRLTVSELLSVGLQCAEGGGERVPHHHHHSRLVQELSYGITCHVHSGGSLDRLDLGVVRSGTHWRNARSCSTQNGDRLLSPKRKS